MSSATVLTLSAPERDCPAWCAQDPHAEATGSHVSAPVRLAAPEGASPGIEVPLLSVQIGLGHDEEARGEPARLWLSAVDGTAELDSTVLGSFIDGLEHFALSLRGLRHRYDVVIRGGVTEAVDHYPSATHPLELVTPCPPWCQYRDENEHTPGLLVDHFHAAHVHEMELALQPVTRTKDGPDPEILELGMVHMGHARQPQIDLTVGGLESSKYVALTFEEADELRTKLNEFIAAGREYVQPEAVASLQELIDYCGVRVVECEWALKGFYGHAVGDTRQGGPVWVTVPRDTTGPRLEERVTSLLAELHEREPKLIAQDGTEVRYAGRVPGVPVWPEGQAAA
ncbi:DUF6907 domain-containing protein [Streptomyces cupreus]|uniref:Uncharacterized protein n=1 Tax=Streptomyces cupreus TaxID=2759956 RepID=A0A7X1IZV4_9ACTN|nr:hypothetical protein [Streptomyces cupreus]MBC2901633.1 hypothetical protein [Streptomyces cupreus]